MPLYEYECSVCHHRYEKIESFSAPSEQKCPKCGKTAKRQLAAPAIQFKGSGWYVTDYARKNTSPSTSSPSSATHTSSTAEASSGNSAASGTAKKATSEK